MVLRNKSKLKKESIPDEEPHEENKATTEEHEFIEERKISDTIVEEQPEVEEPLVIFY